METLVGLLSAVLLLTVLVGAIAGLFANARISRLRREVDALRMRTEALIRALGAREFEGEVPDPDEGPLADDPATVPLADVSPTTASVSAAAMVEEEESASTSLPAGGEGRFEHLRERLEAPDEPLVGERWVAHLQQHWMTWLGGACVALAGIFLVRYSMDRGWLGPVARIVAALATGSALLGLAEYLRRRQGGAQPALAALAGAGSITLYGALLAALRSYDLISPGVAFGAMALVGLGTMALALLHGPVLAAFGMLGAYLVPILVSSGSGDARIALVYALIIGASGFTLLRFVYRPWLWWGVVIGATAWWFLSLGSQSADGLRTLYLTALAYLAAAAPTGDWALRRAMATKVEGYDPKAFLASLETSGRNLALTYGLFAVAVGLTIAANPNAQSPWLLGLPFFGFVLWVARSRDAVFPIPWLALAAIAGGWLLGHVSEQGGTLSLRALDAAATGTFLTYLLLLAALATGGALWLFAAGKRQAVWASLATLAPVLLIMLAYALLARPDGHVQWGVSTLILGLVYLGLGASVVRRQSVDSLAVWLFIAGHLGLGVAAAMVFDEASLTLAIAAQAISLAWVMRSFSLPGLGWLLKVVLSVVIVRLTLNPWLASYPQDVHWSLWTYGGAAASAAFAAYWLRGHAELSRWAEGAALHLGVLTVWSEIRYQLYGGQVYDPSFNFTEATLLMCLGAAMGLVYHYRAQRSEALAGFFRGYGRVLVACGAFLYGASVVLTLTSNAWVYGEVGKTPIVNLLLLAFGAPVLLGLAYHRWYGPQWRERALQFSGLAALVFVSVEIRHLWAGTVRLDAPPTVAAELYTYSVIWLLIAIGMLLAGRWRLGAQVYRAGLGLLGIVIAKVFLVDLSDLDGLLRVASFMGLGLSLLGVAYLHQRLGAREGAIAAD